MLILVLLPWLAGLLMQEPYGYIAAVGLWSGVFGFLMIPVVAALVVTDGFEPKTWQAIGLLAYLWIANWILL